MTPTEYTRAVIEARNRALAVDASVSLRLLEALEAYAEALARSIAEAERNGRIPSSFRRALLRQARSLAADYRMRVDRITATGIRLSANTVASMVDSATIQFVAANAPPAYVFPGDLRSAAAYVARLRRGEVAVASRFRTLLDRHADDMAREVDHILTRGMVEAVDPATLARRLRGYVRGSESFGMHLVEKRDADGNVVGRFVDLRRVPASFRGAAKQMRFNAERIAHTEMHVAAHETTVEAMREAPMVGAVSWRLAQDRGAGRVPDVCDMLATADWYGLGPGIYPVGSVPPLPHPFDRCRTVPVFRAFDKWGEAKPAGRLDLRAGRAMDQGSASDARKRRNLRDARRAIRAVA